MTTRKIAVTVIEGKRLTNAETDLLKKIDNYATCPICGKGNYGGIFMKSCDNPNCRAYDSFAMGRCGICRAVRRECCC